VDSFVRQVRGDGDRRRYSRTPCDLPVRIAAGGSLLDARLLDISGSGALVDRPVPLPIGAEATVIAEGRSLPARVARLAADRTGLLFRQDEGTDALVAGLIAGLPGGAAMAA
jgi:hypothetical protein